MEATENEYSGNNYGSGILLILVFIFQFSSFSHAQQLPDTSYKFSIYQTAYITGKGPLVYIDEAHNNFHTKNGGFYAFGKLLEQDGYQVRGLENILSNIDLLNGCKVLVIANALNSFNVERWILPTPSAFSEDEIIIIKKWVESGGNLLLIADHMPFAGAAFELGRVFGFEFVNGFAVTGQNTWPPSVFSFENNTLQHSPITEGIKDYEKIDKVSTFTGSAFKIPEGSTGILKFLNEHYSIQPDTAWKSNINTPKISLDGFHQGAILKFGNGKVAVFGEAAMFTAQIVNGNMRVGFNSDTAPQNAQFVLNLIHWLDGVSGYSGQISK